MCPICLTTATVVAASSVSGVGLIGLLAMKFRAIIGQLRPAGERHD